MAFVVVDDNVAGQVGNTVLHKTFLLAPNHRFGLARASNNLGRASNVLLRRLSQSPQAHGDLAA